ncbi:Bug family tripartite tricarboxylate transporter substrate binding protein [Variibacter gotjawalensis]|nr:tripartite tricarboxylate transporter substrate binding protein [Variibacter gotjawalensis]NIK50065.1 tripartite-type tricarboxylate transporter receptor subunit TctC [Variibacter gotjawalensis]
MTGPARAQAWPTRPVKIIVPFGLGGSADVMARYLAEPLREILGQPVIVENRPGAGAVIGTDAVAKSEPDGYTLLMMSNTHTANETLLPNRPYQLLRDLVPVASCNIAYNVLVVHPSVPAKSLAELIAYAKANPGKLNYASSGPGTPYHIVGEIFRAMAGIEVQHVPFRGSDGARNAIVAGQVQYMFDAIPTMRAQINSSNVRGLATTGPKRDVLLPDLPTVAETLAGFDGPIWLGLMAAAKTPPELVARINTAVNQVLAASATREWMEKLGSQPMPMSAQDFAVFMARDVETQRKWITEAKISVN